MSCAPFRACANVIKCGLLSGLLALASNVAAAQYGNASATPLTTRESMAGLLSELEPKLMPLTLALDSLEDALRPDSGAVRADSVFLRRRFVLSRWMRDFVPAFDSRELQVALYPSAYHQHTLPPEERRTLGAIADSLLRFLRTRAISTVRDEGWAYFELSDSGLCARMERFLTAAGRDHCAIIALQDTSPAFHHAAAQISWDELGERIARMERFVLEHRDAPGRQEIADRLDSYLYAFLAGIDNDPIFDYRTRSAHPSIRRTYERYIARNEGMPSARVVSRYLALLRANGYRLTPAIQDFLRQYRRY